MEVQFKHKLTSVKSVLQSDKTKHFKVGHPALQKKRKEKISYLFWFDDLIFFSGGVKWA